MEPLSITCDTCSARLKVRDPAAIGQILSCPKCQSMVLVEVPEGWSAESASVGKPGETAEVAAPPLPDNEPVDSPTASSFDEDALFDESLDHVTAEDSLKETAATAPAAASLPRSEVPKPPEAADALPELAMPATTSAWARLMATSAGRWMVFGGGSLAFVLLGTIGWFVLGDDETEPQMAEQQQQATSPQQADAGSALAPAAKQDGEIDVNEQTTPDAPAAANPFATPVDPEPAGPPNEEVRPNDEAKPDDESPFDNGPTDEIPTKPSPADPIDPIIRTPEEPAEPEAAEKPIASESSTDLLAGMDLLDEGELFGIGSGFGLPGEPAKAEPDPKQPAVEPVDIAEQPEEDPDELAGRELAPVDVDAGLGFELIGVKYQRSRMTDFLETMADLSGVPITIDLAALEPLKVTAASLVNVTKGKVTVGELVNEAVKKTDRRLGVDRRPHGLTITPISGDRPLAIDHPIDDLAATAADRAALVELIKQLVPPGTWSEPDGTSRITDTGSALHVEHGMQAQYQVIVFLEKLRTSRHKPSGNQYYDASTFALTSRRERAAAKLAKTIDLNLVLRQPLASVVRKLEWAAGTSIVVDWESLRGQNVGRETPVRLVARGKSLSEAMDALVGHLGLAWRVHDAATLQIRSKETIGADRDLEVYDLRKVVGAGLAGEDLLAEIRRDTDPQLWQEDARGGRMHFDKLGACLIVLANQATQVQVQGALDRLRKEHLARRGG